MPNTNRPDSTGGLLKNQRFINEQPVCNFLAFTEWQGAQDSSYAPLLATDTEYEPALTALLTQPCIGIFFDKFNDGRGYSLARLLREAGFQGELRALGDVLIDQLFYLKRCGFNAFQLRDDQNQHAALEALSSFSVTYQSAADEAVPVYHR